MLLRGFNALGTTQAEFAARLGVDPASVNRWLKGSQLPGPTIVPLLADTLGLELDELWKAIGIAQRDETKQARREASEARSQLEIVLAEMRHIIQENRDINDQIGRDVAELRTNFKEISKQLRAVSQSLNRIAHAFEAQRSDAQPL